MRFKLVPDPPARPAGSDRGDADQGSDPAARTREFVADAQRAVPLVPGSEDDCCARLMRRLDLPSRDVARTWLTFLRALELAEETDSGFRRRRVDPTPAHLRDAFLRRVFGAEEALAAIRGADECPADDDGENDVGDPVAADAAFRRFRDRVPTWEHHKNPDEWESIWAERFRDVLDWLVLLGLAERTDAGYRAVDGSTGDDR